MKKKRYSGYVDLVKRKALLLVKNREETGAIKIIFKP